jgi:fructose-1,6-bisphosphatase I
MESNRTLGQFITQNQADFPYAKGELSRLLRDISIAAKIINREINKAGLMDIFGETDSLNIQGETQKKLDIYANEQFISALQNGGECCIIVSEESDKCIHIESDIFKNAKYIVAIDPLDGSSNIDVNVSTSPEFPPWSRLFSRLCTNLGVLIVVAAIPLY